MSETLHGTVVLIMLCGAGLLFARDKPAIAVLDLSGNGLERGALDGLTNRLRAELFDTECFTVVERGEMEAILREQGFQQTGCTDASCAVEVGQLLNVRFMIVGSVDKLGSVYSVNVRQVGVETGEVVNHVMSDCRDCSIEDVVLRGIRGAARRMAGLEEEPVDVVDESARTWELLGMTKEEFTAFRGSGLSLKRHYFGATLHYFEHHEILVREDPPDTAMVNFYFQDPGLHGGGLTYLFTVWSFLEFLSVQSGLWAGYTEKTVEWWTARSNGIDDTWNLREARKNSEGYSNLNYTRATPVKERNYAAFLAVLGLGYRFVFVDLEYNLYVGNQPLTHAVAVGLRLKI